MNRSAVGVIGTVLFLAAASASAQSCAIGRRVTLDDGNRGAVVASSPTAGSCYVELDNGTVATATAASISYDDGTGVRPPVTTAPPTGAYVCTTPGFGIDAAAGFTLVDTQNYSTSTGQRLAYRWDSAAGMLELTRADGTTQRYRRMAEKSFRRIDGDMLTDTGCVLRTNG
ncbi:MAG TPA: hypothetical protein VLF18_09235 [Tahibacter sp.]|uniref:hypothetical protein n=1 Tax=Tahibacter sp. TaxID=2056211 RepID=UPI002BF2C551|nr:hypothetical protein [Tahibacter sp.]HSX60369.1 hypothetical protein [Tahibacter sp.]